MNVQDSTRLAPYIAAIAAGRTVQCSHRDSTADHPDWQDIQPDHLWDLETYVYRVKPQPVLSPYFKEEDIVAQVGKIVRTKASPGWLAIRIIGSVSRNLGVWHFHLHGDGGKYTAEQLLAKFEFMDGKPCGCFVERTISEIVGDKPSVRVDDQDDNSFHTNDEPV